MSVRASVDDGLIAAADWIENHLAWKSSAAPDAVMPQIILFDGVNSESISVPSLALLLFGEVLRALGDGGFVMLEPRPAQVTVKAAADALQISRVALIKLLDSGDIPHTGAGRHRRISLWDLVDYQNSCTKRSCEALGQLAEQAQELLMGYRKGEGPKG